MLSTIILGVLGAASNMAPADDLARLRTQAIERFAGRGPTAARTAGLIASMRPDGSWPDIDYANALRGHWATYEHMRRLEQLAAAYNQAGKPALAEAVARGLRHWLDKDYRNSNWWYQRIGVPMTAARMLLMMGDGLEAPLRDRAISQLLGRAEMGMTGQNKVWVSGINFMKGLLTGDRKLIALTREAIFSELRVTSQEGIQADYSFHQHGPQQQWGNYGAAFGGDMITWAAVFRGTSHALSDRQMDVLRSYLLEGSSWVVWKGRMDISACGRQIFPRCQASKGGGIVGQLSSLAELDVAGADELRRRATQCGHADVNGLAGSRHYWRSDMTVHRRPTWYASVKMSSNRVIGAETCNTENLLGLHLGDGATYFYRTGREYDEIFPVWDWRRLPGVTCRQDDGSLVPSAKRCRVASDFVGGVGDGLRGAAAMAYVRDGLRANKAWFFLDRAVVCLGAGISCRQAGGNVLTSVNQCVLAGPVTTAGGAVKLPTPEPLKLAGPAWVHHDGIGYVLGGRAKAALRAGPQEGNWKRVAGALSSKAIRGDVMSLWIDHGPAPADDRYEYIVYPDVSAEETAKLARRPGVDVLRHDAGAVAIAAEGGKLVLAAMFQPGRVTWGDGGLLSVDRPCLVLLDLAGPAPRLTVSDPTHKLSAVTVDTAGHRPQTINLPTAELAGKSVTVNLGPGQ